MIACPYCHARTDTRETRTVGNYVRRRRGCPSCGARITTVEIVVAPDGGVGYREAVIVSKRDLETLQKIVDRALGKLPPEEPIVDRSSEPTGNDDA